MALTGHLEQSPSPLLQMVCVSPGLTCRTLTPLGWYVEVRSLGGDWVIGRTFMNGINTLAYKRDPTELFRPGSGLSPDTESSSTFLSFELPTLQNCEK